MADRFPELRQRFAEPWACGDLTDACSNNERAWEPSPGVSADHGKRAGNTCPALSRRPEGVTQSGWQLARAIKRLDWEGAN